VLVLGVAIRSIFGTYLLSLLEGLVARVPIVGLLYGAMRQLAEAFVDAEGRSKFQSVVLVQFPLEGSWVIGFVTGAIAGPLAAAFSRPAQPPLTEGAASVPDGGGTAGTASAGKAPAAAAQVEMLTVFVPTTPLPTQGFTLIVPRAATRPLNLSVEEALKLVVSGGVATKPAGRTLVLRKDEAQPGSGPVGGASV